jgi:hypothetical protein
MGEATTAPGDAATEAQEEGELRDAISEPAATHAPIETAAIGEGSHEALADQ